MTTLLRHSVSTLIDYVFPPVCHLCESRLAPGEKYICAHCLSTLPRTLYHRISPNAMELRFAGQFPFVRATSFCFYSRTSQLSTLIQDFKYRKFPGLARHLGEVMATELLPTGFFDGVEIVMAVPMYWKKKLKRGYNQAEMLASGVASVLKCQILDNLKAEHPHKTQTSMTKAQRYKNIEGIFSVDNPSQLSNRHVLIIDDVCTTGATIAQACSELCREVPDIKLTILTLGVTF